MKQSPQKLKCLPLGDGCSVYELQTSFQFQLNMQIFSKKFEILVHFL